MVSWYQIDTIATFVVGFILFIHSIVVLRKIKIKDRKCSSLQRRSETVHIRSTAYLVFIYVFLYMFQSLRLLITENAGKKVLYNFAFISNVISFLNSNVNIFVYSGLKPHNRIMYRFMLTHRPCQWGEVQGAVRAYFSRKNSRSTDSRRTPPC